jgi:uncharacterized protein YacL
MDNSIMTTGIVILIFGWLTFIYAEYLRKIEQMDLLNFRLYIFGILGIIIGLIIIFKHI